jgi:lysophospholipase L1-like esterase
MHAPYRGLVLGDSYMQAILIGDDETPPACLERYLSNEWKAPVSILNTGHLGYSPEQYYYTLREYGDQFRPQFVVVSICSNDFGDPFDASAGDGGWEEGEYWLELIHQYCNTRNILCLITPVPDESRVTGPRKGGEFQGKLMKIAPFSSLHYVDAIDDFVDEHLRAVRDGAKRGERPYKSVLYNGQYNDGHFSPRGAEVWARAIGRRLALLIGEPPPELSHTQRPANHSDKSN